MPATPNFAIFNPGQNNDIIGSSDGAVQNGFSGSGNTNSLSNLSGINYYMFFQGVQIETRQW